MPLETFDTLLNACAPLWATCKVLISGMQLVKIVHATNAACCMTLVFPAANTAGCTPHFPNLFLMKLLKFLQA